MGARATSTDWVLPKVKHFVLYGWPEEKSVSQELLPSFSKRCELSIGSNCLLWGIRVIIPVRYQNQVLNECIQAIQVWLE